MTYLTDTHEPPPEWIIRDAQAVPTGPLLERDDAAALATLGIYPHLAPTDPAPLGITWTLADGIYVGAPSGTAAEIAAAIIEQEAQALAEWRASAVCSKADGQLALDAEGLLDTVETWIATQPRAVQIEYESRTEWRRDWPLIEQARVAMGWTQERVDGLFESAQAL